MGKPEKTTRKKIKTSKENDGNNTCDGKENTPKRKKQRITKLNPDDAIGMSKQLAMKKNTKTRSRKSNSEQNNKIVLNGKPMPSLADLEKMFEDSDDEHKSPNPTAQDAVKTPLEETTVAPEDNKVLSPSTVRKIADRMMDIISNISDPTELLPEEPPPPIVPPKKRKKPDQPYIVGCKDRPQVINKPSTNFCKGDSDYGVDQNSEVEDECPKKRSRRSRIGGFSKSIFNAQSDEIAERLKANEDSAGSSDSCKTVAYDFNKSFRSQSFSPLPSTSHDRDTFYKNDELFNESLTLNNTNDMLYTTIEDDVQIVEVTYETIDIENIADIANTLETNENSNENCIEVTHSEISKHPQAELTDDCCVILESTTENVHGCNESNNEYALDLDNMPINLEDEVIDVDSLIAENTAILKKIQGNNRLDSIIEVDDTPNSSEIQILDNPNTTVNLIFETTTDSPSTDEINIVDVPYNNDFPTTCDNIEVADQIQKSTNNNSNVNHNNVIENSEINTNNGLLSADICNVEARNAHEDIIQAIVSNFFAQNKNRIGLLTNTMNETEFIRKTTDYFLAALPNSEDANNAIDFKEIINATMDYFLPSSQNQRTNNIAPLTQNNLRTFDPQFSQTNVDRNITPQTTVDRNITLQTNVGRNEDAVLIASTPKNKPKKKQANPILPPTMLITDSPQINGSRNLGDCPICMDSLSSNVIASTICGHVFCLKCIQAAIKSSGKRCPTCRKVLKGNAFHPLFL